MDDYELIDDFLTRLEAAASNDALKREIGRMRRALERLRLREASARGRASQYLVRIHRLSEELHHEDARHADTRADIEKAWIEGHEQGVADGFAECLKLSEGRAHA